MTRVIFGIVSLVLLCATILMGISCNKSLTGGLVKKETHELRKSTRIIEGKLANGIRYFFMANNTPKDRCALRLHVGVGSLNESEHELGMAHMIEHLAFLNRAVSKDESLHSWFLNHGMSLGADANAYTSQEQTVYHINLPTCDEKEVIDALAILRNFADGLQFNDDDIRRENNIIDAEDQEYKNTQGKLIERSIEYLMSGTLYPKRPVLGKREVRETFTKETITAFYKKWYQPHNFTVILVGDYGALKPAELIRTAFSDIRSNETAKSKKSPHPDYRHKAFIINEPELPYLETTYTIQAKKLTKPNFNKALQKDRLAFGLAIAMLKNTLLLRSKESEVMLHEPRINGFFLDHGSYEMTISIFSPSSKWEEAYSEAFAIVRQAEKFGFSEQEFETVKLVFKDQLDQWIVAEETVNSEDWANRILDHVDKKSIAYDARDYQTVNFPILASITKDDCQNALKNALNSGNHYIFAIGDLADSKENVERLKAASARAKNQKIIVENAIPPTFRYGISCANANEPNLRHHASVDVYTMDLPNKISVVLKPNKQKLDEIRLRIFADSTYISMPESDFTVARVAASLLLTGGLKHHPPEEITRLVREKNLFISLALQDENLLANATTRNKDLHFTLELLRAYILEPLYKESSLIRLKEQIKTGYAAIVHDMWAPLQHDFIQELTNKDYRVGRTELNNLLRVTRDDLLTWHKKYISGKKLNVLAVGDFDVSLMAKEIACVFGSLKKCETEGEKAAHPITLKSGINKTYEVKTKDETSKIALRYALNFSKPGHKDHRLVVLRNVLEDVLWQKLREKKQIVYSPSVEVMMNANGFMPNWLDIVVSVPKSKAEAVKDKIVRIMGRLSKEGIKVADLKKAKAIYLTKTTEQRTDNDFLLGELLSNFRRPESLHWLNTAAPDINAIKTDDINKLLKQYFSAQNTSTAIINAIEG